MSKADNNWYIQNSIWIAKRDEQARKAAAREKGLAEGVGVTEVFEVIHT